VFRGSKEVTAQQVQEMLGLARQATPQQQQQGQQQAPPSARFMQTVAECDYALTSILEEMQRDPFPVKQAERALRCTGVALSVAIGLLECCFRNSAARIILFTGGPCTFGPGQVVGTSLDEAMRHHGDMEKGNAKHVQKAVKYYKALAQRLVNNGHVLDVFASALDQVGTMEMRFCIEKTGGVMVITDTFTSVATGNGQIFKESFKRLFTRDEENNLKMAFNGTLEVKTSREFKVCGAIGPCASLGKKSTCVAENVIGQGDTCAWRMCGLEPATTLAFFFEIVNQHSQPIPPGQLWYVQFVTTYQHSSGQHRLRVTTIGQNWVDGADTPALAMGFDQEAAAAVMARYAVQKTEAEEAFDILRWLDRMLIRLCAKFADYRKDDPNSFQLSPYFQLYPQFMFHLRRSPFLQVFNSSPDESAFHRGVILRESTTNCLIMIQPTLLAYGFQGPPAPVLLDATSIQPDRILLLDTYFQVVVFHGDTISAWRQQGYHNQPEHENFRNLLQAPQDDAALIMSERFPFPRYIDCDQRSSQARVLLSKVNPSVTHTSSGDNFGGISGEMIKTDDVSLQVFEDHLKRLAVQSQ
jgi:protein transport protein SEC23